MEARRPSPSLRTPTTKKTTSRPSISASARSRVATPNYLYEHLFIDNASTDSTVAILKRLAQADHNVKLIVNARNFGHIRSPIHALFQARGDVMIGIASDFQEPPDLIPQMIAAWEEGSLMVLCVKRSSGESGLDVLAAPAVLPAPSSASLRSRPSRTTPDSACMTARSSILIRSFNDPYPYFRGMMIAENRPAQQAHLLRPAGAQNTEHYQEQLLHALRHRDARAGQAPPRCRCAWLHFAGFCGSALSFLIALRLSHPGSSSSGRPSPSALRPCSSASSFSCRSSLSSWASSANTSLTPSTPRCSSAPRGRAGRIN